MYVNVGRGVFRDGGHGGGIFDNTISGMGVDWGTDEELVHNVAEDVPGTPAPPAASPAPTTKPRTATPAPVNLTPMVPTVANTPVTTIAEGFFADKRRVSFLIGGAAAVAFVYFYAKKKGKI